MISSRDFRRLPLRAALACVLALAAPLSHAQPSGAPPALDDATLDRAVPGPHQNYLTPEQHIPENGLPYPWETCMTMAGRWSYVPNDQYKPTDELIEKQSDIVSNGGNVAGERLRQTRAHFAEPLPVGDIG